MSRKAKGFIGRLRPQEHEGEEEITTPPKKRFEGLRKVFDWFDKEGEHTGGNADDFGIPKLVETLEETVHQLEADTPSPLSALAELAAQSSAARQAIAPFFPRILMQVRGNNALDIGALVEMIPALTKDKGHVTLEAVKTLFNTITEYSAEDMAKNAQSLRNLLTVFEYVLMFDVDKVKQFFIQAGAFQVALAVAKSPSPLVEVKSAVADSLRCFHKAVKDVAKYDKAVKNKHQAQSDILDAYGHLLAYDSGPHAASRALDFFSEDGGVSKVLKSLLKGRPNVVRSIVLQLCAKKPNHLTTVDTLLQNLTESEDTKKLLREAFQGIFSDPSISPDTIVNLVAGLNCSYLDTRRVALDAGFCQFFIKKLDTTTGADLEQYLTAFNTSVEEEQMVGAYLALEKGAVKRFIQALGHEVSSVQALSASILGHSLDGHLDEESKRNLVVEELKDPEAVSAILNLIRSGDSPASIAGLNLLADLFYGEDGTESWNQSDNDPPPATPLKDQIASANFITEIVGLFQSKNKELATAALRLLSQVCWGYPKGTRLTKLAFEAVTPTADAYFFSFLDEDWGGGRRGGRQRRFVQAAAATGGGLVRVEYLLRHAPDSLKEIKALVEGYRALLCGEDVDRSIGRRNPHLPGLIARMLKEGGVEELAVVRWIIQLVHDDENLEAFSSWKDVATTEVVESLAAYLDIRPEKFDRPERGDLPWEEYQALHRVYEEKVATEKVRVKAVHYNARSILEYLVALLKPFTDTVLGALVGLAIQSDGDSDVLKLVNTYASAASGEGGVPASLRRSVKELIDVDPAPPTSICHALINTGGALALAFYQEGFVQQLISYLGSDKGNIKPRDAARLIDSMLVSLPEDDRLAIRKVFFAQKPAVDYLVKTIASADKNNLDSDFYAMTSALGSLAYGYPDGITVVSTPKLYQILLHAWDGDEVPEPSVALLLGLVCHQDSAKLIKVIRQHLDIYGPPGQGGKGEQKEGRLSKESICQRLTLLIKTTPAARKAVIDAGLVKFSLKILERAEKKGEKKEKGEEDEEEEEDEAERTAAFLFLTTLDQDQDAKILDSIVPILPTLARDFAASKGPMVPNLQLAAKFTPSRVPDLIQADYHRVLLRTLSEMPAFGDFDLLLNTIQAIAASDAGYGPVVEGIKELLQGEETYEASWGHSLALRRLLYQDPKCAKAAVEGGAVDYAIKLLGNHSIQFSTKAAALVGDLSQSKDIDVRAQLVDLGAPGLVEAVLGRAKAATDVDRATLVGDEKDTYDIVKGYIPIVEVALQLVKGDEVPEYEASFYL